jgi:hypothetical protein
MTAALGNFVNGAFNTLDGFVYPQFLFDSKRPPTSNDIFPAGTRWLDNSVNPKVIYQTTGAGVWYVDSGASGSFTTVTATGNITSTAGNVVISGAGKQLQVEGGAVTDFIGTATLVLGTVTIANTNIAATDRIFIQRTAANASTTLGELSYTISASTSFTITSLILGTPGSPQTGDLSSVTYFIVRQL